VGKHADATLGCLVVQVQHETDEPDEDFYRHWFTGSGGHDPNFVDYFLAQSHGRLDLSGCRVFPKVFLEQKRSE